MDRKTIIHEMRKERKTYQEIADSLGITKQRVHQIYKNYSSMNHEKTLKVRDRDDGMCVICDSTENLEVHHINGIRRDNHLDNLVTLCRKCHVRVETQDKKNRKQEKRFGGGPRKRVLVVCTRCTKKTWHTPSVSKRRKYCSQKCRKRTPEERRNDNRERAKKYYHENKTDPEFRRKTLERNKRYYQKNIEKMRERARKVYYKNRAKGS